MGIWPVQQRSHSSSRRNQPTPAKIFSQPFFLLSEHWMKLRLGIGQPSGCRTPFTSSGVQLLLFMRSCVCRLLPGEGHGRHALSSTLAPFISPPLWLPHFRPSWTLSLLGLNAPKYRPRASLFSVSFRLAVPGICWQWLSPRHRSFFTCTLSSSFFFFSTGGSLITLPIIPWARLSEYLFSVRDIPPCSGMEFDSFRDWPITLL